MEVSPPSQRETQIDGRIWGFNKACFDPFQDIRIMIFSQKIVINILQRCIQKITNFQYQIIGKMIMINQINHDSNKLYIMKKQHNSDGFTIAMIQAINKKIPEDRFYHNPEIQNNYGQTVEDIMIINNIKVPEQWKYLNFKKNTRNKNNSKIQKIRSFALHRFKISKNQQELTQDQINAFEQAKKGIIPNEQYQFDPELRDNEENTICYYLWINGVQVPDNWQNQQYKNPKRFDFEYNRKTYYNITNAMKYAIQGQIPDKKHYHNPNIKDENKNTVAYYLKNEQLLIPNEWYNDDMRDAPKNPDFIQQAMYGIIPKKPKNINSDYKCGYGWTVAMLLAYNNKNIPKQWQHNKYLRNYYGQTVQMILQEKHIQVPEYWQYTSEYDYNGTPAIQQARKGIIPNKKNYHEPWISTKYGDTVAYLLIRNGIEVPEQWRIKDDYNNPKKYNYYNVNNFIYNMTKAMMMAKQGRIPYKEYEHRPEIQDNSGYTVAMYLASKSIIPPKQWIHDPNIKGIFENTVAKFLKYNQFPIPNEWYDEKMKDTSKHQDFIEQAIYGQIPKKPDNIQSDYDCGYGWTVAMLLAYNGKNIPKEWQHNKLLTDNNGNTVAMHYALRSHKISDKWKHDKLLRNKHGKTIAMCYAKNGYIPPKEWKHQSELQDKYGRTVAMYLACEKKDIPEQWEHDKYLRNNNKETVQILLHKKNLNIPEYWQYPSVFDYLDNSPAMLQAQQGQIPSKDNYHDPKQSNINGDTVATLLASKGIIPPKEWQHDPKQSNTWGDTVAIMLMKNKIQVPDEWLYEPEYILNDGQTTAMRLAEYSIDIPKYWEHDKLLTDKNGQTIAMHYASYGHISPQEWEHQPELQDIDGDTVAMLLSLKGNIIPEQWRHDKLLKNNKEQTVGIIYSSKGIIPDSYWMHDVVMQDNSDNSIRSNLLRNNYIYQDGKFIYNVQTEIKQQQCYICQKDEEQEFIKTICGHNVCLQCFKDLFTQRKQNNCPECKQKNWVIPINEKQYQEYQQYLNQLNKNYFWL